MAFFHKTVMRRTLLGVMLALSLNASAAQPTWLISTLNNIRRAIAVAGKAKTAGRVALALGKCSKALPDEEIEHLARIASKPNGVKELNKILGAANFIGKYGDDAGHLVLQDTYLRIAVQNGHISKQMASEILNHLGGTPGLTSLLSKINSSNISLSKGHMFELATALSTQKRGFTTISLGQKFSDGIKKAETDLDVFSWRDGKKFALECKAYSGNVPEIMVREDTESLLAFCRKVDGVMPVFCFESPPSAYIKDYLARKGVTCLAGTPDEIATKLDILSSVGKLK